MALVFLSPIHRATRQVGLFLEERLAPLGVTPSEGHLLSYLRGYAPCPIGELHRVFGFKRSTLTSMLDRMERRGWVERRLDAVDRRSFLVELTSAGRSIGDRLQELLEELEREVRRRITRTDLAGFQAVLAAVADTTRIEVRTRREAGAEGEARKADEAAERSDGRKTGEALGKPDGKSDGRKTERTRRGPARTGRRSS